MNATYRFARISPRKTRYVVDLIRGKSINEATKILSCVQRRASLLIRKTLNSAISNANQQGMDVKNLIVFEARVDGGPMLKRYRPGPMGRAMRIRKRSSHIVIRLAEKVTKGEK
jgi:large subunit ribosomal protein L22